MEKKIIMKIEDAICDRLKAFAERGINSASDVADVKNATSIIKNMEIIKAMEQHGEDGSSYDEGGSYRRHRRSYDDGGSGRRYYDGDGGSGYSRRSYDDSYDGGPSGHDMRQKLERMMQEADSDREKQVIKEMLNKL